MAQLEIETQTLSEVAPSGGRFACPSCGSMLRTGAILCPHCEADLWAMAHGGPAPSPAADADELVDAPLRPSTPADRRRARRSLVLATIALAGNIVLLSAGLTLHELSWRSSPLGWSTTVLAVVAVYTARQVVGRVDETRDKRGLGAAKYGLILGMASVAYAASALITWSIDRVVAAIHL